MKKLLKTGDRGNTQLAKMSIDPEFAEVTTDAFKIIHITKGPGAKRSDTSYNTANYENLGRKME